jgi:hypothetical protein
MTIDSISKDSVAAMRIKKNAEELLSSAYENYIINELSVRM